MTLIEGLEMIAESHFQCSSLAIGEEMGSNPSMSLDAVRPVALVLGILGSSISEAAVVVNDAVLGPAVFAASGSELRLTLSMDSAEQFCGVGVDHVGGNNFRISASAILEYYRFFEVTDGTFFDADYVSSHAALVSNTSAGPSQGIVSAAPSLILAYWDSRQPLMNDVATNSDHYGWVKLTRSSATSLSVVSSATALGGGIIVGTITQIPEPSTAIFFSLGAVGCTFRRRIVSSK